MSLMDRIKVHSFLDMTLSERIALVEEIRAKRFKSLRESKIKKPRKKTTKAKSTAKKSTRKTMTKEEKALKLLAKLNSAQIKNLENLL